MSLKQDFKQLIKKLDFGYLYEYIEKEMTEGELFSLHMLYKDLTEQSTHSFENSKKRVVILRQEIPGRTYLEVALKTVISGMIQEICEKELFTLDGINLLDSELRYKYDLANKHIHFNNVVADEMTHKSCMLTNINKLTTQANIYLQFDLFKCISQNLERLIEEIGNSTDTIYTFNVSKEMGIKDFAKVFRKRTKSFKVEKNWVKYLNEYYQKNEGVKSLDYLDELVEELIKNNEDDIGSDDKTLLNKYFGVEISKDRPDLFESVEELGKLIGMEEVKEKVRELLAYLEFNDNLNKRTGITYPLTLHMCLTGEPGTGKTTVARIIAKLLYELDYVERDNLMEVDKASLIAEYVGQTAIKTFNLLEEANGGVLFIDEAYSITDDKFGGDAVATLIKYMEDHKDTIVIIFAGYEKEMEKFIDSNPGIKSRLGYNINFHDYSSEELIDIFRYKVNQYKLDVQEDMFKALIPIVEKNKKVKNFGNGRFMDRVLQEILLTHSIHVKGMEINEGYFLLTANDIPDKYTKE